MKAPTLDFISLRFRVISTPPVKCQVCPNIRNTWIARQNADQKTVGGTFAPRHFAHPRVSPQVSKVSKIRRRSTGPFFRALIHNAAYCEEPQTRSQSQPYLRSVLRSEPLLVVVSEENGSGHARLSNCRTWVFVREQTRVCLAGCLVEWVLGCAPRISRTRSC